MNLLSRLGFKNHGWSAPLGERQLRKNRQLRWLCQSVTVLGLLGAGAYLLGCIRLFAIEWTPTSSHVGVIMLNLCLALVTVLVAAIELENVGNATRAGCLQPLPQDHCPLLRKLSQENAAVHAHVATINAQGRPLYLSDWYFIEEALRKTSAQAEQQCREDACRELHLLA